MILSLCVTVIQSEIQSGPRDSLIDLTSMKDSSLDDVRMNSVYQESERVVFDWEKSVSSGAVPNGVSAGFLRVLRSHEIGRWS